MLQSRHDQLLIRVDEAEKRAKVAEEKNEEYEVIISILNIYTWPYFDIVVIVIAKLSASKTNNFKYHTHKKNNTQPCSHGPLSHESLFDVMCKNQ